MKQSEAWFMEEKRSRAVTIWLFICCTMVILVVGIGGFTRLTRAGLSITEWRPITGTLPPLSVEDWLKEKSKYEATPEYKAFNYGMSMEEFQAIYLIEYIHRLIARLTGLIFILPFVYFILRRKISKKVVLRLLMVLLFGMLQAFAGWYMVKSGLVAEPHVSYYRLALHMLLGLIIFALLSYQFFDYQIKLEAVIPVYDTGMTGLSVTTEFRRKSISSNSLYYATLILILITIQMIFGAFVAGLKAGLIYNTFPLMDGHIIPNDLFFLQPAWLNVFENRVTVQFIHRLLALLILVLTAVLTIKNVSVKPVYITLLAVIIQIILGVVTLLFHVPTVTAILHQVFSFILFASSLYSLCYLRGNIIVIGESVLEQKDLYQFSSVAKKKNN